MKRTHGMSRAVSSRILNMLVVVGVSGLAVGLPGCGRAKSKQVAAAAATAPGMRLDARPELSGDAAYEPVGRDVTGSASARPINTTLAQLSKDREAPEILAAGNATAENAERVRQVQDSARMLDDYFQQVAKGGEKAYTDGIDAAYDPSVDAGPSGRKLVDPRTAVAARTPKATIGDGPINTGLGAMASSQRSVAEIPAVAAPAIASAARDSVPASVVPGAPNEADELAGLVQTKLVSDSRLGLGSVAQDAPRAPVAVAAAQPVADAGGMQAIEQPRALPGLDDPGVAAVDPAIAAASGGTAAAVSVPVAAAPRGPSLVAHRALTPEQRKNELVDELVGVLNELAQSSDEPYRVGLALAGLEALSPGALTQINDAGLLMPHEAEVLLAAHELFEGLVAVGGRADTGSAMDVVERVHDKLRLTAPLKISTASLCTRVAGYGQYDTFPANPDGSYTFVAGRRQPVIVYVEVDRFGRKPVIDASGTAGWDVTLSQELQIYHAGDDLMVTSRPAETDRTVARSKMRDYYLINQTYLPESLGVGRYHLKVVMRDKHKDAVAEMVIPIQIVAQPTIGAAMGS